MRFPEVCRTKAVCLFFAATNQYSAALNLYLQAGAVCSDFFTKAVPPDVYSDQVVHTGNISNPDFVLDTYKIIPQPENCKLNLIKRTVVRRS